MFVLKVEHVREYNLFIITLFALYKYDIVQFGATN